MFYSAPLSELNDPTEGFVNIENIILQIDVLTNLYLKKGSSGIDMKSSIGNLLDFSKNSGIYSLSRVNNDELLWAHYGESHQGFCIEYNYDELFCFEKREGSLKLDVDYSSSVPDLDVVDLNDTQLFVQKVIGTKSLKWSYEEECRILTSKSGLHEYDFRAVKSIYFGLRMPNENKRNLMQYLQGRNIKYYQMTHKDGSYLLESKSVVDEFVGAKKYMYSISPIAPHAVQPDLLNKKWVKYKAYLQKVAEIVRREPYCNLVEMAEVSFEKSSDDAPLFFGQFERKKHRLENIYYTCDEVDRLYEIIEDLDNE